MLSNLSGNKEYVDYFFKNHKLFFCDNLSWKFYNLENAIKDISTNLEVRLDYLFSKNGFFNSIYKEYKNPEVFKEYADFSYNFKNKRYINQEFISNGFNNPTHHSFKPNKENYSIDFHKPELNYQNVAVVTHPGNTRFYSSVYLQKNLNKCFVYVNKKYYHDNLFNTEMVELTSIEDTFDYWVPVESVKKENLRYDFVHIAPLKNEKGALDIHMGSKRHNQTECSVLKLWKLLDISKIDNFRIRGENKLHTLNYMSRVNDSGKDLGNIVFEKNLTIYTNSNINVKENFLNIRNTLINKAKLLSKKFKHKYNRYNYFFNEMEKFDFNVVVVDEKPNNISELNGNRGFAIWIDKSEVKKINREIFEFLVFTRKDIKLAETTDGKISVVNCKYRGNEKWTIHKEFYL